MGVVVALDVPLCVVLPRPGVALEQDDSEGESEALPEGESAALADGEPLLQPLALAPPPGDALVEALALAEEAPVGEAEPVASPLAVPVAHALALREGEPLGEGLAVPLAEPLAGPVARAEADTPVVALTVPDDAPDCEPLALPESLPTPPVREALGDDVTRSGEGLPLPVPVPPPARGSPDAPTKPALAVALLHEVEVAVPGAVPEGVPVALVLALGSCVNVGDAVPLPEHDAERVPVGVNVSAAVPVGEGVPPAVRVAVAQPLAEPLAVPHARNVPLPVALPVAQPLPVAEGDPEPERLPEALPLTLGQRLRGAVGDTLRLPGGPAEAVPVGTSVGTGMGDMVAVPQCVCDGERDAEGEPLPEPDTEGLTSEREGEPLAVREKLADGLPEGCAGEDDALALPTLESDAQLLTEALSEPHGDTEGEPEPLSDADSHCEMLAAPVGAPVALPRAEPDAEGGLLKEGVPRGEALCEGEDECVRLRGALGDTDALRVGAARLPLPQFVTVHDCDPEGQPEDDKEDDGEPHAEGVRDGRAEAVRLSVCVPHGVALRQPLGDAEGLPDAEGEPLGEPLGGGEALPLAVPPPPSAELRDAVPDTLRLAVAVPAAVRLPGPGVPEPQPLTLVLPMPLPDALGECEAVPPPLTVSDGDTERQALIVGVPRGEGLKEGVGVLQGLPEPGALRLPLRVGEGVAERVTAPLGGAVSVDDTELLRRGVADAEAHAERERVPLPLTVPELQKLREPGAVTDAERERHAEGEAVAKDVAEPPAAAAPPASTKLGDALCEGLPEGLGDADGGPPLREAQPEGVPVRGGVRDAFALTLPGALRVSERVPEGDALTLAEPEGEPLAGGERDAEGQGEGERVTVAMGVLVRVRVLPPDAEGERVTVAVEDPLGGDEALPQSLPLAVDVLVAERQPLPLPLTVSEGEPLRPPLLEGVALAEAVGAREGDRLPLGVALPRGEDDGVSDNEEVTDGDEEPVSDGERVSEGAPVADTHTLAESLAVDERDGERLSNAEFDGDGECEGEGVEEVLPDVEGDAAPLREALVERAALPLVEGVVLWLTLRVAVGVTVPRRRDGEPVPLGDCVPYTRGVIVAGSVRVGDPVPLSVGDALPGAVGGADTLPQLLALSLTRGVNDVRGLAVARGVQLTDGETMDAVAVPEAGGESLNEGDALAEGEPLEEPLCEGQRDAVSEPLRVKDPVPLRVGVVVAEGHREPEALAEGQREPVCERVMGPLRDSVAQLVIVAVARPLRDGVAHALGHAVSVLRAVPVAQREGDRVSLTVFVPEREVKGDGVTEVLVEGDADTLGQRDCVTLVVKLAEAVEEADGAVEPL